MKKFVAAVAGLLMASSAQSAIVTFNTPISIEATFAGTYVNLTTGATGFSDTIRPVGWDFDGWSSGNDGWLAFFWPTTAGVGGVASGTGGPYLDLAPGAVISSASVFSKSATNGAAAAFHTAGDHVLGFAFLNDTTNAINYGYMNITTTGATGFPATITGWSYENSGAAITVQGLPGAVPEPASWAMMIGGLALVGASMRRRKVAVSFA